MGFTILVFVLEFICYVYICQYTAALAGVVDGFGGSNIASWVSKNLPSGIARYSKEGLDIKQALMYSIKHAELIIAGIFDYISLETFT